MFLSRKKKTKRNKMEINCFLRHVYGILTKLVEKATELDEFSMLQLTMNAHRLHNIATAIGSVLPPAVSVVSYAFGAAVAALSMQNHCPVFPVSRMTHEKNICNAECAIGILSFRLKTEEVSSNFNPKNVIDKAHSV